MVIPVVIFVFAFLINAAFLMYGRCLMIQDSYLLAFEASLKANSNDPDVYVREKAGQRLGKKYFGNDMPDVRVWKSGNHVYVGMKTVTHHKAIDWNNFLSDKSWEIEAQMHADIIDPPGKIRRMERIRDLAGAGTDKIKGKE